MDRHYVLKKCLLYISEGSLFYGTPHKRIKNTPVGALDGSYGSIFFIFNSFWQTPWAILIVAQEIAVGLIQDKLAIQPTAISCAYRRIGLALVSPPALPGFTLF